MASGAFTFPAQVGLLVVEEVREQSVAVPCEQPARAQRLARARCRSCASGRCGRPAGQLPRVPQPVERSFGERGAHLLVALRRVAGLRVVVQPVVGPAPRDLWLPRVVEERREPDGERAVASAAAWTTANVCSSTVSEWWRLSWSKPIAGSSSGRSCDEHTGVARDRERLRRMRSEQQLRELPIRRPRSRRRSARPTRA